MRVPIAFGQLHRHAQRTPARDDRHLVQRIGVRQQRGDDGVARLVVRAGDALVLGHRQRSALDAHQHLVARLVEIGVGDRRPPALDREERRLVHQVRQIGAREARRAARDLPQIDFRIERHLPAVDAEDLLAALHVGRADRHLAIEPARTQQRRIENVGTVRRRDDDDALVGGEAVHLDQQLVQRLLALFVAERVAAAAPSRPRRARR